MRPYSILAAATAVAGCAIALAPPAAATQDPIPIRPNQIFQGHIKGLHSGAQIFVVCPGPAAPGRLGHPLAGQPVEAVTGPLASPGGNTGSLGTSIVASFSQTSSTTPQRLTFTSFYAPQNIPTGYWLPCDGTARVPFTPLPTSSTAVTDYVTVTYVNVAT